MRTSFILAGLVSGAAAFAPAIQTRSVSTTLHQFISIEEREPVLQRWAEIRAMTAEEADSQLEGEEREAYHEYHQEVREGVLKMQELAALMMKDVEPPRIKPKTKGQRKRDKWARVQAREAAKAAAL